MDAHRGTVVFSERALRRLDEIQAHYKERHQLTLSASGIVRRSIDLLYHELNLAPKLSDQDEQFVARILGDIKAQREVSDTDLDHMCDLIGTHCRPFSVDTLTKVRDLGNKLISEGKMTADGKVRE